jgi:hypothetical protein
VKPSFSYDHRLAGGASFAIDRRLQYSTSVPPVIRDCQQLASDATLAITQSSHHRTTATTYRQREQSHQQAHPQSRPEEELTPVALG